MSGLETLPPDQRAVLQLILMQGRGYADLAELLRLDVSAVRDRARAGVDALGVPGGETLDAAGRARIADYLLGQQDDGERIVTFAELAESAPARSWAEALRQRLAALASAELPAVPAGAATMNGSYAAPAPMPPAAAPPAVPAATPAPPAAIADPSPPPLALSVAAPPQASSMPAPPPADAPPPPRDPAPAAPPRYADGPRSSRLGGAILIAGAAALAIVLAIVLLGGGGDDTPAASSTPAGTQASQSTQPRTTPATAQPRIVGQVNLAPTAAGGQALGVGLVQRSGGQRTLAVEAQRLPANGAQDIYAVWIQDAGGARFLGFVPDR